MTMKVVEIIGVSENKNIAWQKEGIKNADVSRQLLLQLDFQNTY